MLAAMTDQERRAKVNEALADPDLPPPAERARLRNASGRTQEEAAEILCVSRVQFNRWERGLVTPYRRHRDAYRHFLRELAAMYPAESS